MCIYAWIYILYLHTIDLYVFIAFVRFLLDLQLYLMYLVYLVYSSVNIGSVLNNCGV